MNVLVAVDGSDASENALAHAIDVAEAMDGTVTAVHTIDPSVFDVGGSDPIASASDADERLILESVEDAEQRGLDVLEEAVDLASEHGSDVGTELLYGDPVEEIAAFADDEGFDAIFVGHRGRSGRTELLVGSVAKQLVERATVPVTVVR
ncbi:universal stress protein [Halobiforma nitratireducens]|uniref:UspA domain-containing protein n=1 Tax=Halobiforma nitratireducens JCM 10879 TaxID=1227454 RepID=M0MA02_9EURY|nr:universal stress protein [Halobiforma nitratireducens]EMA42612.1 UspA domain-containing protein [Halobiforma nitratireducens JCM 10879]